MTEEYVSATMAANAVGNVGNEEVDEFEEWLKSTADEYKKLDSDQRLNVLFRLVESSSPSELYIYSSHVIDLLRRDFISCLPPELVERVISYLDLKSLLRASCVGVNHYMK